MVPRKCIGVALLCAGALLLVLVVTPPPPQVLAHDDSRQRFRRSIGTNDLTDPEPAADSSSPPPHTDTHLGTPILKLEAIPLPHSIRPPWESSGVETTSLFRTIASFTAANVKHFPSPWHGSVEVRPLRSPPLGTNRKVFGEPWALRIRLSRERTFEEIAEETTGPCLGGAPCATIISGDEANVLHFNWTRYVQEVAGPDAFFAVAAGPQLVPFAAERLFNETESRDAGTSIATRKRLEYMLTAVVPLEVPDSKCSAATNGTRNGPPPMSPATSTYVLHLQHHHYNYGAVHDRDRFGAPYHPTYVVGKHDGHGRAGAIKLSRQKLRVLHMSPHVFTHTSPRATSRIDVALTPDRSLKVTFAVLPDKPCQAAEGVHVPLPPPPVLCSLSLVEQMRQDQTLPHAGLALELSGRYVELLLAEKKFGETTFLNTTHLGQSNPRLDIRGWTSDAVHPLSAKQYVWVHDVCDVVSFGDVGFDLPSRRNGSAAHSIEQHTVNMADAANRNVERNHRDEGTAPPPPQPPLLAACFARRRHKILFLGDSQMRSLFHTAASLLTLRKAIQGKSFYGRLIVSSTRAVDDTPFVESLVTHLPDGEVEVPQPHPCPPSRTSTVSGCGGLSPGRGGSSLGQWNTSRETFAVFSEEVDASETLLSAQSVKSYIEMIWDPLLLNLSYYSRGRFRDARRRRFRTSTRVVSENRSQEEGAHISPMISLDQALQAEEDEDSNHRLSMLLEEHQQYGPDAVHGASNATHVALPSGRALHRALVGRNSANVVVLGFGGWFGLHLWHYADVEAHIHDIIDALEHVAALRASLGLPRLIVLVVGTPAWPSYVTWDGHRRNTNSRLGIITQLTRQLFARGGRETSRRRHNTGERPSSRPMDVIMLPYFEISYPVSHMRFHDKDIHYDRSMVPYSMLDLIGTLLCSDGEEVRT